MTSGADGAAHLDAVKLFVGRAEGVSAGGRVIVSDPTSVDGDEITSTSLRVPGGELASGDVRIEAGGGVRTSVDGRVGADGGSASWR